MNLSAFSDDLGLLANILRGGSFRFVAIGHDDEEGTSLALSAWLKERFPQRPLLVLPLFKKTYWQVINELLAFEKGIVLIPDLDWLFHPINGELCVAFNQRRDFFAKMDLAFVCLFPASEFRSLPERLPDWFSVRSGEFDFSVGKEEVVRAESFVPPVLEEEDPRMVLYHAALPWIYRQAREWGKGYGLTEWESEEAALTTLEDIFLMYPEVAREAQSRASPKTYVSAMLKYKMLAMSKKTLRDKLVFMEELPERPDMPIEDVFPYDEFSPVLQAFLETLSERDQQLLRYFYGEGYSMAETAKLMGQVNASSLKARKARLLQKLTQFYQDYQRRQQAETHEDAG